MEHDEKKAVQEITNQISHYRKLQEVADDENFAAFFDLQLKTVAEKILWTFLSGKDGDNVKNWEDFVKARGEIVARLHPIQEIYGSDRMIKFLEDQLEQYRNREL